VLCEARRRICFPMAGLAPQGGLFFGERPSGSRLLICVFRYGSAPSKTSLEGFSVPIPSCPEAHGAHGHCVPSQTGTGTPSRSVNRFFFYRVDRLKKSNENLDQFLRSPNSHAKK
jgi:hypothetical protein